MLAGRGGDRPSSEGIEAPGADVVGIGFGGVGLFERLGLVEVTIGDAHESGGPLVFVGGVNALEGFLYVGGIETDQGILPDFGAMHSLGFHLVDGALATFGWILCCKQEPRR